MEISSSNIKNKLKRIRKREKRKGKRKKIEKNKEYTIRKRPTKREK